MSGGRKLQFMLVIFGPKGTLKLLGNGANRLKVCIDDASAQVS